ncbi:DUF418 domain-containing protein [Altererythrobacter sp. MF3-039]|uniref:DUF418 domain-containing protein n=1 Tax=Altererythrobacter sp. MF3-039 TaxID=3252901 RepID=UPI00390CBACB
MNSQAVEQVRPARVEYVDALRGYALFGLLMVHAAEGFGVGTARMTPDAWGEVIFFFFSNKAFMIFALLFGFSFATIMGNQRARGVDFTGRFAWRLLLLMVIGTLHGLIYNYEILQVLAILGLLLIPLDRVRSPIVLLAIAGLCFLQIPLLVQLWMATAGNSLAAAQPYLYGPEPYQTHLTGSFTEVISANAVEGLMAKWSVTWSFGRVAEIAGLFALGVVLQRTGFFARLAMSRGLAISLIVVGGSALVMLYLLVEPLVPGSPLGPDFAIGPFTERTILFQWISLASITAQIGLLALLWNSPVQRLIGLFRLPGRMTLTLYVAHSLIAVPVLYQFGLGMGEVWDTRDKAMVAIAFFGLQILIAQWWYARYRYGPLEWTWRAATLNDWSVPLRVEARTA